MMLDGAENWVISSNMFLEIQSTFNKMIRGCMRLTTHTTRKYRITTADLLQRLKIEPIQYYLDWRILGYVGHVQRMPEYRLPKQMRDANISGPGKIGAPPKTHSRQINESLKRKGMGLLDWQNEAMDKNKWRDLIKGPSIIPYKTKVSNAWICDPECVIGQRVEKSSNTNITLEQL